MSRKFQQAAALAVAAMMVFTITGAAGSGALAQDHGLGGDNTKETAQKPFAGSDAARDDMPAVRFVSHEVVQKLPQTVRPAGDSAGSAPIDADSLADLVDSMLEDDDMSKDMRCLASAIYFEARGEPLIGQLAVGQVIVNRAGSGTFPSSYCGVVYQHSQFSFVHGGRMPAINTGSNAWHDAAAIARIAHEGMWDSPAKDALYFHATYAKPAWRRTQVARVDSHIFYR